MHVRQSGKNSEQQLGYAIHAHPTLQNIFVIKEQVSKTIVFFMMSINLYPPNKNTGSQQIKQPNT